MEFERRSLLPDLMTEQEIIAAGSMLEQLQQMDGWSVVLALLERYENNIGKAALNDASSRLDYWRGRLEQTQEIKGSLDYLVEQANELKEHRERVSSPLPFKFGQGGAADIGSGPAGEVDLDSDEL